jgi:2-haloacid dehalogenase
MAAPLPTATKLITFDTYGTLIDWDTALREYTASLLTAKGSDLDPAAFHHSWYFDHALPAVSGPFMLYRDLLQTSLHDTLIAYGIEVEPTDGADVGDAMAEAEPFPDAVEALGNLANYAPLATISNSQADIITHSVKKLGDPFTYVFTGEVVQHYKPHPALFELVLNKAGVAPENTIHIAQSQYVDLPQSVPMGLATVWINRHHQTLQPGIPAPTLELHDLVDVTTNIGLT